MHVEDYILEQTDRTIESDQFSHQQDAFDAGVGAALDALKDWLDMKGQVYSYEFDKENY